MTAREVWVIEWNGVPQTMSWDECARRARTDYGEEAQVVRYIPAESAKAEAQPAGTGWVSVHETELEPGVAYWVIWEGTLQNVPWVWFDGYSEGDPFRGWHTPGDDELVPDHQTELCMRVVFPPPPEPR